MFQSSKLSNRNVVFATYKDITCRLIIVSKMIQLEHCNDTIKGLCHETHFNKKT